MDTCHRSRATRLRLAAAAAAGRSFPRFSAAPPDIAHAPSRYRTSRVFAAANVSLHDIFSPRVLSASRLRRAAADIASARLFAVVFHSQPALPPLDFHVRLRCRCGRDAAAGARCFLRRRARSPPSPRRLMRYVARSAILLVLSLRSAAADFAGRYRRVFRRASLATMIAEGPPSP